MSALNASPGATKGNSAREGGKTAAYIPTQRDIARFWSKVDKRSPNKCWNWMAAKANWGYGVIGMGGRAGGTVRAHRFSWELEHGPIPDGMNVLHHCDNPACVNPRHLFLGDDAANHRDMVAKGRESSPPHPKGEGVGTSKLTWGKVREIRRRYATGEANQHQLADEYGVTQPNIGYIVRNESWREEG